MLNKIELLAPAGDLEKLKIAILYGADAVYFGGENFSLRAASENFSYEDISEGVDFVHERGKKCYMTVNIFPHNQDILPLIDFIESIKDIGIDGFIVSDFGVVDLIKETIPDASIHISTQANVTNYRTVEFWKKQGAERVVLAREMSLEDIRTMREKLSDAIEIEAFVHGAMCISYSGRCLLSNYMVNRDANRGGCAHPCRWKYKLVEEKRPDEYYPVEEDERGTYIMNSKDLCMIENMGDIINAGVKSAKIEGRMKSIFYVATIVSAYRRAIDDHYAGRKFDTKLIEEVSKVSNRHFTTGFYYGRAGNEDQNYDSSSYFRDYIFLGIVREYDPRTGMVHIEQRNKMVVGDEIEVFGPGDLGFSQRIEGMWDADGNEILAAPHPQQMVAMKLSGMVSENYMLRKRKGE